MDEEKTASAFNGRPSGKKFIRKWIQCCVSLKKEKICTKIIEKTILIGQHCFTCRSFWGIGGFE
jgi:hypothetical protein